MTHDEIFAAHKPLLFSIAYRMLGSVMDAEDAVQECYLRWQRAAGEDIRAPKAYLASAVTRLSIDRLRQAQTQREVYVGTWLPEPVFGAPAEASELADSLSLAFLTVLESLSPVERAVLLLHDVFDYDYAEVAQIIGKSEANARQILSRARRAVAERRPRFDVTAEQHTAMLSRFAQACLDGDLDGLLDLLAEDVVSYSDGGGRVAAATRPVRGAAAVARFLLGVMRKEMHLHFEPALINGQPGIVALSADGQRRLALVLDLADGRIRGIYNVRNPDKLQH